MLFKNARAFHIKMNALHFYKNSVDIKTICPLWPKALGTRSQLLEYVMEFDFISLVILYYFHCLN
jgi:hypothetical protein